MASHSSTLAWKIPWTIPFISFSYMIAVGRSSNMSYISGETGHPCLLPEFSGKTFNFLPVSIMLAMGLL